MADEGLEFVRYEAYDLPWPLPIAVGLTMQERQRFLAADFVVVRAGDRIPAPVLARFGLTGADMGYEVQVTPALRLVGGER